jgi:hypothetical protein
MRFRIVKEVVRGLTLILIGIPHLKKKSCGQFHQHFMSAFAPIFLRQKSSNLKRKYKKASLELLYEKKLLVKLTPSWREIRGLKHA